MSRKAVSLFSGCGGFCEGVRLAGFEVTAAVEIDRFAAVTYRENFPEVPLYEGDVHAFLEPDHEGWSAADAERFSDLQQGETDWPFGGPPCQGYSQIGARSLDDPRNELYLQYIRILTRLRPKAFLMENVPNMLLMAGGRFKRDVIEAFKNAGRLRLACESSSRATMGSLKFVSAQYFLAFVTISASRNRSMIC